MTPAARAVVEAVHAGAVLTMHYRPADGGETLPRFVLEPAGRAVYAPTAQSAIATPHLTPADDGLFAGAAPQTWTAGEPLQPDAYRPPAIKGSTVRDTTVRGLTVRFAGQLGFTRHAVLHAASGASLLGDLRAEKIGRRDFVARVNASRLAKVDWSAVELPLHGDLVDVAVEARRQIEAAR